MPDPQSQLLAERIAHERELREAQAAAFAHERELRAVFDAHERELRLQVEDAVARNLERQATEYERRLSDLNGEQGRIARIAAASVTRELFDLEMEHERERADGMRAQTESLKTEVDRLVTQLQTLRGLALFIGLPGIIAFLWSVIAAANNITVTGPNGLIP